MTVPNVPHVYKRTVVYRSSRYPSSHTTTTYE